MVSSPDLAADRAPHVRKAPREFENFVEPKRGGDSKVINAEWHKRHPMPPRATARQRLKWHLDHARACGCRKLTAVMLRKLRSLAAKPTGARARRRA